MRAAPQRRTRPPRPAPAPRPSCCRGRRAVRSAAGGRARRALSSTRSSRRRSGPSAATCQVISAKRTAHSAPSDGATREAGRPGTGGVVPRRPTGSVAARPGGFGAGGRPIGEEFRSRRLQWCARGHDQDGAGEAPAWCRPSPLRAGCFSHLQKPYGRGRGTDRRNRDPAIGPRTPSSHAPTVPGRTAGTLASDGPPCGQTPAKACSMMSRPSLSRSSPMTSGGRKRSTLP